MSYCRWSSMNWRCDVYVYEHVCGGWMTHVAGKRKVIPPIPNLMTSRLSRRLHRWAGGRFDQVTREVVYPIQWRATVYRFWLRFASFWHKCLHMKSLDLIPLRKIGLPFDGESFSDETPGDCADRLEQLSKLGYTVPRHAIKTLRSEHAEAEAASRTAFQAPP